LRALWSSWKQIALYRNMQSGRRVCCPGDNDDSLSLFSKLSLMIQPN
jgi:hypothetical protein